jgi:hypothetical protein
MGMTSKQKSKETLRKLAKKSSVFDLDALFDALGTRSRMTVFRRLRQVGYLSSFTHGGRFYTLEEIPQFDELGLWFHRDIGFSQAGTLKETVVLQVEKTSEGRTHEELQHLLHVRAHNTLLELLRQGRIGRERLQDVYLYVSADSKRAAEQVAGRKKLRASLAEMLRVATDEEVVEVLVEALRAAPEIPTPDTVAGRLVARGVRLEPHHVEQVYEEHGLVPGKKTVRQGSRSSRR